ncbi:hypothetical protein Dda_0548 [Drechslerella dactyloides]|uniref:Major facilitator superfamily (MFS) profile domain-containing protein n=1 Tax=Drechslerella dactyloides TaxID=74499 RepID=A0AAD6J7Y7_DREDA|nr:hypothetical protein Dda_0548 [Drechslerella dactyloides]
MKWPTLPAFVTSGRREGEQARRPLFLGFRSSKEFIMATVTFGIFVDILLYSIVVPVLPFALVSRANVDEASVQRWISVMLAVYGAGLLVASPIFGYVADHTKYRRSPFLWGLILLAASTAMFCVGNSIAVLVVARLLQGMSGGCIWVVGLALVIDTVPANEQSQSMGFVAIGLTAGSSLGPLLGGVVYEKAGYLAVFILAFGVIGVDIVMRLLVIEKSAARQWLPEPPADANPSAIEDPSKKNANPGQTIREAMLNNSDATARAGQESRIPAIILLLKVPRQLNSIFLTVVLGSIFSGFDALLPLRVKYVFNFNATAAGLVFLAIIIPSLLAPLLGRFSDRYGPRWFVVGAFFLAGPFFVLLRLPSQPETGHIVLLCALLACIGFVVSAAMPGAMGEISATVIEYEKEKPGVFGERGAFAQAYALFNIAYSGGSVIGPLLGGFLNDAVGWNNVVLVFGVLCLFTSFVTVFYTGGKITKDELPWNALKKKRAVETQEADGQEAKEEPAVDVKPSERKSIEVVPAKTEVEMESLPSPEPQEATTAAPLTLSPEPQEPADAIEPVAKKI